MRASLLVLALSVLIVPASATIPPTGTEEEPEVTDAPGNVQYDAKYQGPKDRHHIDILSFWLEYDAEADVVVATLKVVDSEGFFDKARDWEWLCWVRARIDDPRHGDILNIQAVKNPQESEVRGVVYAREETGPSVVLDIPSTLRFSEGEPGYVSWTMPRAEVQLVGSGVRDFTVECYETQRLVYVALNLNQNTASAPTSFSFVDLQPKRVVSETGTESAEPTDSVASITTEGRTALPVALTFAVLALAALSRRRLQS